MCFVFHRWHIHMGELEECFRSVFSSPTQQVLVHFHLKQNMSTDTQEAQYSGSNSLKASIKKYLQKTDLFKWFHLQKKNKKNIIINGRVNNFKDSIHACVAFA